MKNLIPLLLPILTLNGKQYINQTLDILKINCHLHISYIDLISLLHIVHSHNLFLTLGDYIVRIELLVYFLIFLETQEGIQVLLALHRFE